MPRWAIDITAGTGGFEAGAKRVSASMKKAEQESQVSIAGIAAGLSAAAGLAVGLGAGFLEVASTIAGWRDELGDASTVTGMAAETMAGLQLAAESTGSTLDELLIPAKRIPKLLSDVDAGSKSAIRAFAHLGVETRELDGSLRSNDAVFRDVIKRLGEIQDPSEKARRAVEVFGKGSAAALEALSGGLAQFESFERIASKFGIDTGPAAAESAALMQAEIARLGLAARGAGDDIWQAFGGDEGGGLSVIRAMTAGVVFASTTLVELRKNLDEVGAGLMIPVYGTWKAAEAFADAMADAKAAAQDYLTEADQADRIMGSASAAAAALGDEIETTGRKTRDAVDPAKDLARALEEIERVRQAATEDTLSAEDKIADAYNERLVALGAIGDAHADLWPRVTEAIVEAEARMYRDLDALRLADEEKAAAASAKAQADLDSRLAAELRLHEQYQSAQYQGAASLAGSLASLADSLAGEQSAAQLRAWRAGQIASAAEVGINTIQAISEASASAPPPWNLIPMGAALAQGVALEAAIWSQPAPVAYTGLDLPYASPQGTPVVVHPGESVRTRTETEQARRPALTHVETWIGGRRVADTVASEVRRGGALTAELTRRTGRLGHSADTRRA